MLSLTTRCVSEKDLITQVLQNLWEEPCVGVDLTLLSKTGVLSDSPRQLSLVEDMLTQKRCQIRNANPESINHVKFQVHE